MKLLAGLLSILSYSLGILLAIEFYESHFLAKYFVGLSVCFLIAYFLWPSRGRGKRNNRNFIIDIIEAFIELPIDVVLFLFRVIARMLRSDGPYDFDV
ncbi:hypothetical protein [Parendozoicomonas sp. Alg238-R29]|uniref:hypothetical protein n=1 Tax=Parendozoicomonas sp. Alg238-R29 TaxID=2993446 RepID=UPI00248F1B3B|nr:hypothetical protein [Parendozoicomonas sp. Alg238-R29]